ncbi:MAG: T9SS type A sorting domain-containing protein [Bacteroidales bacterium]|nr:T9SS type A sorting domain-containing protein [Bacteroidales bacterium]
MINTIQIQNYVTPYGIQLNLGADGFTHVYDVSDYVLYLKDSVDFSAHNTQELIDITFAFIEGTPPRNVIQFNQVYLGDFGQYNIGHDISLQPTKIFRNNAAQMFRVKTRTTGHGMSDHGNCAEFCPTTHKLYVEGVQRFSWQNWKNCAGNPIYPQGGTWIYDRAGWCPGSFGDTHDFEITPFVNMGNDSILIDYGMTQYNSYGEGSYRTSTQLIQYSAPNFINDAAVEDVVAPNNADIHKRYNPICNHPEIIIKNTGSANLTSLFIEYGLNENYSYSYQWTGNLSFLETQNVILPTINVSEFTSNNTFNVRISAPNNVTDEYQYNNTYKTNFATVNVYGNELVFIVKTNSRGYHTHYTIKNQNDDIIVNRNGLANNTVYVDTIPFIPGCYEINFFDTGNNGLSFWANNEGAGYARLRKAGFTSNLKNFEPDFGSFFNFQFVLAGQIPTPIIETDNSFEIFPNPNDGNFTIELNSNLNSEVTLSILEITGREVKTIKISDTFNSVFNFDLSNLAKGVYFVKLSGKSINQTKKLIIE